MVTSSFVFVVNTIIGRRRRNKRRRRQEKAGNVRVRVFEHVGEDFRAGRRVEFDGFFGGGGAHDVMYDVIYLFPCCVLQSAS